MIDSSVLLILVIGSLALILYGAIRLRREHRSVEHLIGLLVENTEAAKALVQRDFSLTDANARLREIDLMKSEFVSVAAHQLRTPLTGIRWALVALAEGDRGELTGDALRLVRDALASTERMISLINDLLNVARIEEGRFGFEFAIQAMGPIVARVVDDARESARAKHIRFVLEVAPPASLGLVKFDAEKIGMALGNMLDNAIKYTPLGGMITVRVVRDGDAAVITIQDTGIGIPDEARRYIFNKFYRADNAALAETFGTGLGLYVAKNIVEQHGGTISVASEEYHGSTFTIRLPISGTASLASK